MQAAFGRNQQEEEAEEGLMFIKVQGERTSGRRGAEPRKNPSETDSIIPQTDKIHEKTDSFSSETDSFQG